MNDTKIYRTNMSLKLSTLLVLLIMTGLFAGCTTMTAEQCRAADFSNIGYTDASKGKYRDYFNKYHKDCLSHDIDIRNELVMYDYGRERGLLNYCNNVHVSSQCDRGAQVGLRSRRDISTEMIYLNSSIPPIK